jgi:hypothetical protein
MDTNITDGVPVYFDPPTNRQQVRRLKKENEKNFPMIMRIEESFIDTLFDEESSESYTDTYQVHLEIWNKVIDHLSRQKMFKYSVPNKHYFQEKFKPIEAHV